MASFTASFREAFLVALPVIVATAAGGCASLDDVRPVDGKTPEGVSVTYEFSYPIVFHTTKEAAEELRLVIKETDSEGRYFLADDSLAYTKHGAVVGVHFERVAENATQVTVATKVPVFPVIKPFRHDYKQELHKRVREKLDLR